MTPFAESPHTNTLDVEAQDNLADSLPCLETAVEMDAAELARLETVIKRGRRTFVEVGAALLAIHARRGYKVAGFATFETYLRDRWGWSRQRGYQLMQAATVVADFEREPLSTQVVISTERHARILATLPRQERQTLVSQLGDVEQYSTRELHQAARLLKATIRARPAPARPLVLPHTPPDVIDLDDRIEQGLAEDLPWSDGEIDVGITSPPYCLGSAIAYAEGGDYEDYDLYRSELLPNWCLQLVRVTNPAGGRWCVNVPIDSRGPGRRHERQSAASRPVYADWLDALRSAGFEYRTTIFWHDDQAGLGTDRGTPDPSAPHVTAPLEAIIVVYRNSWKRPRPIDRTHDLEHDAWLQMCGPRGLWRFPGVHDPVHPAPFPEELPRRLLQLYSWRGDVIGDCFVGRGTTAAVAARLGRRVRAIDRSSHYVTLTRAWVSRERSVARPAVAQFEPVS